MPRDYAPAYHASRERAEAGDRQAQYALGVMHGLGLGAAQDYGAAVRWYERAARAGEVRAQCNLGFMFGTGRGVPQDFVRAYAWYSLAGAAGDELSRRNRDAVARRMSPGQVERGQALSVQLFDEIEGTSGGVPEGKGV